MGVKNKIPASYKDPSGFVYFQDGILYRQINDIYKDNYEQLMDSGLYDRLVKEKLLISHDEVKIEPYDCNAYLTIKPHVLEFISYPYEWCFGQLKDAALHTLQIQKIALEYGMSLKDCSAYNIQFNNKPIFIDTLSFEKYIEGIPWVAYNQFCQQFLAPLALVSFKDIRLSRLLYLYLDGIPLDLASSLLPLKTYLNHHLLLHIHLHSKAQAKYSNQTVDNSKRKVNKNSLLGLIDSLETSIRKMNWSQHNKIWSGYYYDTSYSSLSFECKKELVTKYLTDLKPISLWDLGGNTGLFSRIASRMGIKTISFDIDPGAVEKNYHDCIIDDEDNLLPLLIDLTNPSSKIGWLNEERMSLFDRGPVDTVLALALIHHLAIAHNLPLERIAQFFKKICKYLVIEFIPKYDEQVQRLLLTRDDIFHDYNKQNFENEFEKYFSIKEANQIINSDRLIYLMENKNI